MTAGVLRPLSPADAPWAARQHARLMANSVFALFGEGFLACFYREFAGSPHAVAFVWEAGGAPRAVIASAADRGRFLSRLLLRRGPALLLHAAAAFLRSRACRRLLGQSPRYLRRTGARRAEAEMVFITVDPACRGAGVGEALIEATLAELRRRGVRRVGVSIESDNAVVRGLLERLGFRVVDRFVFADKPNDLLERDLDAPRPAAAESLGAVSGRGKGAACR